MPDKATEQKCADCGAAASVVACPEDGEGPDTWLCIQHYHECTNKGHLTQAFRKRFKEDRMPRFIECRTRYSGDDMAFSGGQRIDLNPECVASIRVWEPNENSKFYADTGKPVLGCCVITGGKELFICSHTAEEFLKLCQGDD